MIESAASARVDEMGLKLSYSLVAETQAGSGPALWRHKPLKSLFQLTRNLDAHQVTIFRTNDLDPHRKA